MGTLLVESTGEPFKASKCQCSFCLDMNRSFVAWEQLQAKTNLQYRMKEVVKRIERRSQRIKNLPKKSIK